MAKKKQVVKKKKKDYISFLRELTNWICSNDHNKEQLQKLLDDSDSNTSALFRRITSYCYSNPHLIWYFNKYFNSLFDSHIEPFQMVTSIIYAMELNGQTNRRNFFYLKSSELKDYNKAKVKKTVQEYFDVVKNKYINDVELNFYYRLFTLSVLTHEELNEMYTMVHGKEAKL